MEGIGGTHRRGPKCADRSLCHIWCAMIAFGEVFACEYKMYQIYCVGTQGGEAHCVENKGEMILSCWNKNLQLRG